MTLSDRERLQLEREILKDRYQSLYDQVLEILFRHDPIDINYETNTDEYDPEVGTILPRLKEASSENDVQKIVHEEFRRWFSLDAGGPDRYGEIASEIWTAWRNFQAH